MTAVEPTSEAEIKLPSAIELGVQQALLEVKVLLRSKDMLFFTLGLPLMFLLVFGVIFSADLEGTDVSVGQWFTPGIIAASVLSAGSSTSPPPSPSNAMTAPSAGWPSPHCQQARISSARYWSVSSLLRV